ncbi:MAG: TnsA endonuclease N-terminal domain-containing protein [Oscillospiraceae bacterium]|nr:TnsA endonuclease N-terminal domain-containing protein [Oscillospiraceae bacterium]
MAKHRRVWNSSVYERYVREGRGQGVGADYKPWIVIQDFASKGMVSRVVGTTTGRVHHLMSNLEMQLFYLLDWSDGVTDIREQYPLSDLSEAINIAENKRIRYPYDSKSGFPYVMTSDFYIDTQQGASVLSVKPSSELLKPRVREKLEIEHRYWSERGVTWCIITEHEINRTKATNIEWLAQAKDLGVFGLSESMQNACIEYFLANYSNIRYSLSRLFTEIERLFNLVSGMGLNIFKHLAYWKRIAFNADEKFHLLGIGSEVRYEN